MNIHKIRPVSMFVALVLLVGFVFGFSQWENGEFTPTSHTVTIASECDVFPNPVNVAPGDVIQFNVKEEAGQCTVLIDQPDVTDLSSLQVPGLLGVKTDTPVDRDYPYDVTCSSGSGHSHGVPSASEEGLGSTSEVSDEPGNEKICSHTRIHLGPQ